ncbi:uncharacterized protein LOC135392988 isoform X3 [Ornithodoros turicata]|uniref:uncharacterized protein LOC135392988 isoform X3 n=1 Tax=Ornithodoros turicata TaxID=34597 RepID=UPI0031394F45
MEMIRTYHLPVSSTALATTALLQEYLGPARHQRCSCPAAEDVSWTSSRRWTYYRPAFVSLSYTVGLTTCRSLSPSWPSRTTRHFSKGSVPVEALKWRRREFQCNPRAHAFNRQLVQLCRRSRDLFYLDHGFYRRRPTHVLAADGLHPNFEGVRMMSCHLQDLIPHLLRQLPPRRADAPVNPDPVWPTPQEAAMLRRRHSERTSRARKQD